MILTAEEKLKQEILELVCADCAKEGIWSDEDCRFCQRNMLTVAQSQLAKVLNRPVCPECEENMAQEIYGVYMNDPGNNHLENKEWVLLVEARTKAKQILSACKGTGKLNPTCQGKVSDPELIGGQLLEEAKGVSPDREKIATIFRGWSRRSDSNMYAGVRLSIFLIITLSPMANLFGIF